MTVESPSTDETSVHAVTIAGKRSADTRGANIPFDLNALFAGLETAPGLLLAVSGGPDSIALMLLAAQWAELAGHAAPRLHVATVDHGLRAEARAEAEAVAAAAAKLGLPHVVLTWTGPKPKTRIQERAREARYALLAAHAQGIGATHVVTGHHADDQAETILFRLGRGSGPGGLVGMKRESAVAPGIVLARPLLGLAKAQLIGICEEAGHAFADDPSNHDPSYARVRLRAARDALARLGLETPTLVRLGARLARAEDALEAETRRCLTLAEAAWETGRFTAKLAPLEDAKPEILIRLLRHALEGLNPGGKPPRLDRLETLAENLGASLRAGTALRATLHGTCVTFSRDTRLVIAPEPPRRRGRAGKGPDSAPNREANPKTS
ncbi:MAG: tRNA lysidine(34) synthetase TilS [Beijerinckiaceae bacterium]|nr:tRNA lysidine(34) synthetase TilS [Beijerinckiaceae bacterium]